eukprot:Rhum_TRINITY_DN15089_c4_g1::Rhum_TRINITY_DN15089_c4_g1_i2::g.136619::m.136619
MRTALLCLLALSADAASVDVTVTSIDVGTTTTCAEAVRVCTGDWVPREKASEIPCTFPCTPQECCYPRFNCVYATGACNFDGDRHATCNADGTCLCSANYVSLHPDPQRMNWVGCVLNRV